jgi:hypothetical protein
MVPTPAGPIPTPFPNIAMPVMAIPTVFNQFIQAMPVHNLLTTTPISNGDQAGLAMGVASGMIMGPSRHILGSFKVFSSAMPQTKMLSPTMQNNTNMVGVTLSPAQVKVMVLT